MERGIGRHPPGQRRLLLQGWPLIEAGLIAARFLHFGAAMALFGLALFPVYGCPSGSGAPSALVRRWLLTSVRCAALLGLLSALAWAWFTIAGMTGTM